MVDHTYAVMVDAQMASPMRAIANERIRQIVGEGFTREHDDDEHAHGEMAAAAACYAVGSRFLGIMMGSTPPEDWDRGMARAAVRRIWPWSLDWWKPKDRRSDLIRAAALIVAELERLDRAEKR